MADETTMQEVQTETEAPPETSGGKRKRRLEAGIVRSISAAEVASRQDASAQSMGWDVLYTGSASPREMIMREDLQGRHYSDDVSDMVLSLLEDGQKSPICVRRRVDRYEVIFGNRRVRAGLEILDAKLKDDFQLRYEVVDVSDEQAYLANVAENHQRKALSDIDYAHIIARLKEYGRSQGEIAKRLNRSDAWVSRAVSLLKLTEKEQRMVHLYAMSGGKKGISPAVAHELAEKPPQEREQELDQLLGGPEAGEETKPKRVTREAVRKKRREKEEGKPFAKAKSRSTREIVAPFEAVVQRAWEDTERQEMTVLETVCSYVLEFCKGKIGERALMNALEGYLG